MPVNRGRRPYRSVRRAASVDETRSRILAAARALLAGGGGLPPFSLDGVAKHAGVTRLTVYNQFESKQGLLEAVFDEMAEEGGLKEIPTVFAMTDAREALKRFVSIMCGFWNSHRRAMPKFAAVMGQDDEIGESLRRRKERRRTVLTALVKRVGLVPKENELVDLLYALTGPEMFESLSVHGRDAAAVEVLMQAMVDAALARYSL